MKIVHTGLALMLLFYSAQSDAQEKLVKEEISGQISYRLLGIEKDALTCWVDIEIANQTDHDFQLILLDFSVFDRTSKANRSERQSFPDLAVGEIRRRTVNFGSSQCKYFGRVILEAADCILPEDRRQEPALCRQLIHLDANDVLNIMSP